jgi:hypothetical protein
MDLLPEDLMSNSRRLRRKRIVSNPWPLKRTPIYPGDRRKLQELAQARIEADLAARERELKADAGE